MSPALQGATKSHPSERKANPGFRSPSSKGAACPLNAEGVSPPLLIAPRANAVCRLGRGRVRPNSKARGGYGCAQLLRKECNRAASAHVWKIDDVIHSGKPTVKGPSENVARPRGALKVDAVSPTGLGLAASQTDVMDLFAVRTAR
jgi:hypothetical protein